MGSGERQVLVSRVHNPLLLEKSETFGTFRMAITIEENEKAAFLSGKRSESAANVGKRPYSKLEEQKSCCFGWSKTKICCCTCLAILAALILAITVVCLMLFVFDVGDKSGEAKEWEERLKSDSDASTPASMEGTFILVSYDENYRTYLETMGVPWYVIPIILASNEKFSITELGDDTVQIITETSINTRNMTFKFGEEFSHELPKGMGTMWNVCTRDAPDVMMCRSEEREKDWNLRSKMIFTEEGVVNERTFINGNITAKKYYRREVEEAEETKVKEEEEEGSGIEGSDDDGWGGDTSWEEEDDW